jgi:hypothetical protein
MFRRGFDACWNGSILRPFASHLAVTLSNHRIERGEPVYLIQDPHHEYAVRFIEHVYRKYGHRAVCFYTDPRERLRHAPRFPILRSEHVAAAYDIGNGDLSRFAAHVAAHHDVVAVLPFNEPSVLPAARIARHLGLSWAQPEVICRIQDKFALKEHLRRGHPQIPMNASCRVETLADVCSTRRHSEYRRFVLKPNTGFGNRHVGLFDARTPETEIAALLDRMQGTPMLMEQYVAGAEYFVNGQVNATGKVDVVAIFQYLRSPANGRHNIDHETLLVPYRDPRFAQFARYAEQVLAATGLLRSPFHLELKCDGRGPCLIEIGARLAGHGNAFLCSDVHDSRIDLFDLAAHYYLDSSDYGPLPLNWEAYDASPVRYVHGIATKRELIYSLEGIRKVEALPEFHCWVRKPVLGARLEPTVDSLSMPFSLVLKGPTQEELRRPAAEVRRLLRWNESVTPARRLAVGMLSKVQRGVNAARVRLMSLCLPQRETFEPISSTSVFSLAEHAGRRLAGALNPVVLRIQLLELRKPRASASAGAQTAERQALVDAVMQWALDYLARPHPKLGRPGAICPFVRQSIESERFHVKICEGLDRGGVRRLRRVVLQEARGFVERWPHKGSESDLTSLLLVFPQLPHARLDNLDRIHDELKTHLVTKHDLMCSPFHERSRKPSISNPEFPVFRAPLPLLAIRRMDVRDIVFLDHNARAFQHYRARFGSLYERGEISDHFGHVRRYVQACARF